MKLVVLTVALGVVLGACSGSEDQVVVSAASSLTDVFSAMEQAFEEAHPGIDVVLNVGGSSTLREQILGGARADVYAPADLANMERVVAAGRIDGEPVVFARNRLQIAVPPGNPGQVHDLSDLSRPELLVGVCDPAVPCGALARQVLAAAGVVPSIDTNEPDVRFLLAKIEEGELDAGLVYVTDVLAAGERVHGIDVASGAVTEYPIAVLADAPDPEGAAAFVAFVVSAEGRTILRRFGFEVP